jgi:hypothetical protein
MIGSSRLVGALTNSQPPCEGKWHISGFEAGEERRNEHVGVREERMNEHETHPEIARHVDDGD